LIGWSLTRRSVPSLGVRGTGTYSAAVIALTLDQATNVALAVTVGLAVAAVLSFWVVKSVAQKVVTGVLLGLLAFAVWTQRTALEDCADKVRASLERTGTSVSVVDTDCSFFGLTVTISSPRDE
jgi:ABC-type uncharacterized transport system permease subunit